MGRPPGIEVLSLPATEWARSHAAFFFESGAASVEDLSRQLLQGARLLAESSVELTRHGDWFVVSSEDDWLANSLHQVAEALLFERPAAFPELGQNCTRPEFVVAAFAEEVIVATGQDRRSISGLVSPAECDRILNAATPGFRRAIAFKDLRESIPGTIPGLP